MGDVIYIGLVVVQCVEVLVHSSTGSLRYLVQWSRYWFIEVVVQFTELPSGWYWYWVGLVVAVLVHGDGLPCGQLVLDVTLMLRQQLLPLSRGLALQRLVRFLEPLYTHAGT